MHEERNKERVGPQHPLIHDASFCDFSFRFRFFEVLDVIVQDSKTEYFFGELGEVKILQIFLTKSHLQAVFLKTKSFKKLCSFTDENIFDDSYISWISRSGRRELLT